LNKLLKTELRNVHTTGTATDNVVTWPYGYSRRGIFGSSILQLYRTTYACSIGLFSDIYAF